MAETPVSLLDRLCHQPDAADWRRLNDLYSPLLRRWLTSYAVQAADADDLVQEVLGVLIRALPQFRHEGRPGSFRAWLRRILLNRLRQLQRSQRGRSTSAEEAEHQARLDELEDPDSGLSRLWDQEHDQHVTRRLLELIAAEFEPATWQAFRGLVLEEKSTQQVAAELGATPNAVRIAKSRVLKRLREEAAGLLD